MTNADIIAAIEALPRDEQINITVYLIDRLGLLSPDELAVLKAPIPFPGPILPADYEHEKPVERFYIHITELGGRIQVAEVFRKELGMDLRTSWAMAGKLGPLPDTYTMSQAEPLVAQLCNAGCRVMWEESNR